MHAMPLLEPATNERKSGELPTVLERPEADVIIYDGHCRFCRGQVERLSRWDTGGRLAYLSLHDPEVARHTRTWIMRP